MIVKTSKKHAMILSHPPVGRYKAELKKIQEKPNKAGDGTNIVYSFEIIENDEWEGKPYDVYCSVKHDMGVANMLKIHQCIINDPDFVGEFDNEEDIGGILVGEITHDIYNGNKTSNMTDFYPSTVSLETPY